LALWWDPLLKRGPTRGTITTEHNGTEDVASCGELCTHCDKLAGRKP